MDRYEYFFFLLRWNPIILNHYLYIPCVHITQNLLQNIHLQRQSVYQAFKWITHFILPRTSITPRCSYRTYNNIHKYISEKSSSNHFLHICVSVSHCPCDYVKRVSLIAQQLWELERFSLHHFSLVHQPSEVIAIFSICFLRLARKSMERSESIDHIWNLSRDSAIFKPKS